MNVVHIPSAFGRLPADGLARLNGKKLLLVCGIVFPILWLAMDVAASLLYEGYSYRDQTVSELSAYGAPTRAMWLWFGSLYNVLAIAFALGLWMSAGQQRVLRIVAGLLAANALLNLTMGPISSMHQREVIAADGATFSDTLHLVLVGVGAIVFLFESGFAAAAFGKRFRVYTAATIAGSLVFWVYHQLIHVWRAGKRADTVGRDTRTSQCLRLRALDCGSCGLASALAGASS